MQINDLEELGREGGEKGIKLMGWGDLIKGHVFKTKSSIEYYISRPQFTLSLVVNKISFTLEILKFFHLKIEKLMF